MGNPVAREDRGEHGLLEARGVGDGDAVEYYAGVPPFYGVVGVGDGREVSLPAAAPVDDDDRVGMLGIVAGGRREDLVEQQSKGLGIGLAQLGLRRGIDGRSRQE